MQLNLRRKLLEVLESDECHQNLSNCRETKITSMTYCWGGVGQVYKIFSIVIKVEGELHTEAYTCEHLVGSYLVWRKWREITTGIPASHP